MFKVYEISVRKKFNSVLDYWQFAYDYFLVHFETNKLLLNSTWVIEEFELVLKFKEYIKNNI